MSLENNAQAAVQPKQTTPQQAAGDVKFTVSASPHIRCDETISHIMWQVNLALVPAVIFAIWWFGVSALINIVVGAAAAVICEYVWERAMGKDITAFDGSAFLTGILMAMSMSPALPPYMVAIGSFIAIIIAKQSMGGLGFNIFNPAHVGRAAIMVSWPVAMTTWTSFQPAVDVVTSATPLNILKMQGYDALVQTFGGQSEMYQAMLLGTRNGSLGETSTILLLLGGIYLIWRGYADWHVPVCMIGTVGILTWIFGGAHGLFTGDPLLHMMAGGLIIGAFFMATDMVTIPITIKGQIIFAVGAGAITVLIRLVGGYPEGVCYSILLMNAVTPLIDRLVKPRILGSGGKK